MNPLKCLIVCSRKEYFDILESNISMLNAENIVKERCLEKNLEKTDLAEYDLIVFAAHIITGAAINKFCNLPCQIFVVPVAEDNFRNDLSASSLLYLVRPATNEDFFRNVLLAREYESFKSGALQKKLNNERLKIYDAKRGHKHIDTKDIMLLTADRSYTDIIMVDKTYRSQSHNLNYYTDKLNEAFYRINNATIINAAYIKDYSAKAKPFIILSNDLKIHVTRHYREILDEIITKYNL